MAVSIILTTIGWLARPIFKKATDITWKQFTKRVGLQAEIDDMIAELKSFKLPNETAETREYLKEVKGLISEAKDLLDELEYFQLQDEVKKKNKAKKGNIFTKLKSSSPSDVPSSSTAGTFKELKFDKSDMSKRMKELIKKLKRTCASSPEFGLQFELLSLIAQGIQNMNNQTVPNDRQTNAYQLPKKIYGRDGQIEEIQQLINDAEQHNVKVPVIAIVGNGGVGKTTLAQHVYNHSKVESYLKIWICVSTSFDEKGFTRQMLECCSGDGRKFDGENLTYLKSILISKLNKKKVLLVLDDIWAIDKNDWDSLLTPFNLSNGIMAGSIVLVTTRFLPIAKTIDANPIIKLDGLDDNSFWSLFKSYAFGNDQFDVPYKLEKRRIVHRLGGSPLAAKTVGGLLKGNTDAAYWNKVLESKQWKLPTGKNDIMPTLRLSYEYLPLELKQCFSYCSLFPQDYYFKADELVFMWISQDLIATDREKMEDVGFTYLNELVERGFFEKVGSWVEKYVLHDLMHDLAQDVSKEEIFIVDQPNPIHEGLSLRHVSFTKLQWT